MDREYDVLVVGGCTAGLYFAAKMAGQGYRTLVVEKDGSREHGKRYDIFHLAKSTFGRFGVEEPKAGEQDYVSSFSQSISHSALDNYPKKSAPSEVLVLRRHPFMIRLKKWAEAQGVTVLHDAEFLEPVFDTSKRLSGGRIRHQNETLEVSARLTADASGIASVVRTSLPNAYGVETFQIGPEDKFYVVLYYAKLDDPERDRIKETCGWPYYKTWKAPQQDPDGAIFGVGANLSYEYAEMCFRRFTDSVRLPPHRVMHVEKGCTPYRRSPYSFVADGFVALGDAACLTNPWSGEGISAAWLQAEIAAQEADNAMRGRAYPAKQALWNTNKRYYDAQGAEFAQMLSMLAGAVDCKPQENDYEFRESILFEGEGEKSSGSLPAKLVKGVITGNLRLRTLYKLAGAAGSGQKILSHYQNYPNSPEHFSAWVKRADLLWGRTRRMADQAKRDLLKINKVRKSPLVWG